MTKPRIAIPTPTSFDSEYNERSWPQYARAIERAGGEPVRVPLNEPPAATARLIAGCQGVLLPGSGADVNPQKFGQEPHPKAAPPDAARENVDELLLQDAHNMGKPILTICFGTQMLNVWRGGSIVQDLEPGPVNHRQRGVVEAHATQVEPGSLLATLAGTREISVNSSHHQAIDQPGDGLRVTARSSEDGVVEAVENAADGVGGSFVVGVQWHPERTYDESPVSRALFERFVHEAAGWAPANPHGA